MRIGLGLVGILSLRLLAITGVGGQLLNLVMPGTDLGTELLSMWQRYDALWYQQIAQSGYHAGDKTFHFPPLYPLLSHIVSLPLGGHVVPAELVTSSAAFVVAMWLLYRVARLDVGPVTARLTVLLAAFFPMGFFFMAPYTEGLYLALTLAAFWFARQGKPWAAGLAGFGAGLSRTLAFLLVLPLAFEYLRHRDEEGKRPGWGLLASTLPVWALLATIAYGRLVVGEQASIFTLDKEFFDRWMLPWQTLPDAWAYISSTGDPVEIINLLALLGFTVLALVGLRYVPLSYSLYALPYIGLLYFRESVFPLSGIARYMLVLFPCFIVLAMGLIRRPWLAAGWLVIGVVLQALLFAAWVHFDFLG